MIDQIYRSYIKLSNLKKIKYIFVEFRSKLLEVRAVRSKTRLSNLNQIDII